MLGPPGVDSTIGRVTCRVVRIARLLPTSSSDPARTKGLGMTKCSKRVAVLERASRSLAHQLRERDASDSHNTVKHYLQLPLAHNSCEVFAVLSLGRQHGLLALEELFRGTLTPLGVTLLRRILRWVAAPVCAPCRMGAFSDRF